VLRPAGPVDLPSLVRALPDVVAAERLAAALLSDDPQRLRHVHTVATVALVVSEVLPPERVETLLAAAVLHDVGYAPLARATGFHPLDGAQWLLVRGCPTDVAAAVAHHSEALLQVAAAPFADRYAALPVPDPAAADVLTYADQTTTPDGRRTGVVPRVVERCGRDGGDPATLERVARLVHAVTRVDARLDAVGGRDASLEAVDHLVVATRPTPQDDVVAAVRACLPGGCSAGPQQLVAAVHAARLLGATGLDPGWADEVGTAVRLLAGPSPAAAPAPSDGSLPLPGAAVSV
jgi:hypothetical protein